MNTLINKTFIVGTLRATACDIAVLGNTWRQKALNDLSVGLYDLADMVALNLVDKEEQPIPEAHVPLTHADAIRQMTDEELVAEIGRLQDIAAACPSCHQKTGVERLRLYLSTRADR